MEVKRGDLVTVTIQGNDGKPRPALVIQSDLYREHSSITILPLTRQVRDDLPLFRISVAPTTENGLKAASQVMVDKAYTAPRGKIGAAIGYLEPEAMTEVVRALAVFLGFA